MSGDENLLEDEFDEESSSEADVADAPAGKSDPDARRKVEDRLEELRLKKMLDDYDF